MTVCDGEDSRRARDELLRATDEEWARLEGHAIGRVLDEGPPTEPLGFPSEGPPTEPILPHELPDGASDALRHEGLGRGPHDDVPGFPPGFFEPSQTLTLPSEMLATLRRRSCP